MQDPEAVLTALTIAAGLSLGVERTLELLKQFMDFANGTLNPKEQTDAMKHATDQLIRRADAALAKSGTRAAQPVAANDPPAGGAAAGTQEGAPDVQTADAEPSERHAPPRIPVVPMTPLSIQSTANALFFQFAAAGLGIVLANVFGLRLVSLLLQGQDVPALVDMLFTGLVIGGGSQPIHVLIRFLTERKITGATEEPVQEAEREVQKNRELAQVLSKAALVDEKKEKQALAWVDIPYRGGVYPDRLENQHRRSGDPNLIVYHHTAMSSLSSFQEIVDEFLVTKKWLTGYSCVVMPDGAVKPFCRWDRYGSHAGGLNQLSLGVAFHGNFHTEPGPFSNADGRFGNQQPTEAQLHAGARVVALWVYLYEDINLDFEKSILPHKKAMPGHTVCPGSNFPYDKFERLVREYHDAWSHSDSAQKGIEAFRGLRYVYA